MEGKAPTAELAGAFAKLRQLMLHVYKSVRLLGVTLTDEVRTVFDGMLASDATLDENSMLREAIAELNTGLLGLSQSETAVFRELIEKAGNQALQELAAEKAKQLAGLKKMWSVLADDEIAADRVYQVWQSAVDAGGIDYVAIEEIMGTKVADALRAKGLATKGGRLLKDGTRKGAVQGAHPAEFAAKAGYESVEEMLDELYFTKSPADFKKEFMALAEAQFHKSFAVSESVQSVQATLDTLDRFSDLLAVKGGVEGYRLRKNELIRRAKLRLEAMSVRQIMSDNQLIGDCRKGVRDMTKAVNEGDFITALETAQKLRENLEVMRRKADAKKAIERTAKTLSKGRHAKKGTIYGDHQDALWDISQRFGFTRSQKQLKHTVASVMDEYNSEARENGDVELEVDRYFLHESHPYQAMQYGNFMQLSNLVDFIYGEGKDLVSAQEATRKEKIAADVDRTIQESAHLPAKYTKDAPPVVKAYRTMAQWGTKLRNIIGMATNWNKESTLQRLYDEMAYAESLQLQLMSGVSLRVSEALSALHKSMSKLDLSVISDIRFPERVVRNGYKKWDAEKVAAVCLNLGTANNRQRLRDGFEWSDAELDRIAALLTAEDWQNIQRIWDAIGKGELFDAVRRTFKNENHFDLKEEDAVGFTVNTADGQTIDVVGGYYPLSYLYHKSAKQDVIDANKAPAEHRKASFTFERAAVVSDPVNLSLNILTTHIFDAAHYATHREVMRHVLAVIKNDNFRSNFEAKFGFERYQALKSLTENVAAPGATLKGVTEAWEKRLRAIATASALWMNPSTMLMQLTSFTIGIDELGGYYWEAVAEQYTNYAELRNFVMNRSALMRSRANMMDMDVRRGTEPFFKGEGERAVEKVREAGYAVMRLTDTIVATPVWYAAYNKAMAEGMDDSHAVAYADEFLAKTQGASRAIDMSLAQTTQVGRLFTVFYSAASAAGTMASKTVHRAVHGDLSAAAVACNLLLPTALAALVRWAMSPGGDDDPDRAERALWRELIANPFQGIPGVRNLADFVGEMSADALAGGKPKHGGWRNIFEVIPFRGLNDIGGALAGAVEDAFAGNEERALYRAADAVSMWYQLPVLRVYERAKRIINGHGWADLPDINDTVPKKRKRR